MTLGKMGHICKTGPHLEKWVTVGKMDHRYKNKSQFKTCVSLGSHLEKWVILGKIGNTWKSGSHLEGLVALGKLCHIWK